MIKKLVNVVLFFFIALFVISCSSSQTLIDPKPDQKISLSSLRTDAYAFITDVTDNGKKIIIELSFIYRLEGMVWPKNSRGKSILVLGESKIVMFEDQEGTEYKFLLKYAKNNKGESIFTFAKYEEKE